MADLPPAMPDDMLLERVRNLDVNSFAYMKRKYSQMSLAEAGKELPQLGTLTAFNLPTHPQLQSRLLSLPQELRSMLYDFVFSDYDDPPEESEPHNQYPLDSLFRRPGYSGPPRISTMLTQTCQSIYNETWWMPFQNFRHTFYKCSSEASKPYETHLSRIWAALLPITQRRLAVPAAWHNNELRRAQVFISAAGLEEACCLSDMMDIPSFNPRHLTITVRHVDQWRWQQDQFLRISGRGLFRDTRYPNSLVELDLQFESLLRKQVQVDHVASEVVRSCYFRTHDERLLWPARDRTSTMIWRGSSTWHDVRWVGYESNEEPGLLTYYVRTIPFRPASLDDARVYDDSRLRDQIPHHIAYNGGLVQNGLKRSFTRSELDSINVDRSTPKDAILWKWARKQERERSSAAVMMLAMLSAGGS